MSFLVLNGYDMSYVCYFRPERLFITEEVQRRRRTCSKNKVVEQHAHLAKRGAREENANIGCNSHEDRGLTKTISRG